MRSAVLAACAAAALIACTSGALDGPAPTPTTLPSPTQASIDAPASPAPTAGLASGLEEVLVVRVIDGDTVVLEGGERLRYIGMDTPESTTRHECFGDEATARNRDLVEGRVVTLETDVSNRDRFSRLLRYVYVDGVMVNELLVLEGYANASSFPPDVKYQERLLAAETAAREAASGLWNACVEPPLASPVDCDPAYPDVCIPPPPPDLQCADVAFRNFRVFAPDPHNFDGNDDGEGCEAP